LIVSAMRRYSPSVARGMVMINVSCRGKKSLLTTQKMERETGLEPATYCLEGSHSTN